MPLPELLAPAGDWDALRAAVLNGADAVYFGLSRFSARQRAANFTLEELPQVMAYLRDHNARGYVAFNTLVFSSELADAQAMLEGVAQAGAHAVIVQDLGVARLIRRLAPGLPIHASTQMSLTDGLGLRLAEELGVTRAILARELSLDQIRRIVSQTSLEIEVFVHGALCVSYSGQCLASLSLGGRSANRGECAQPCRLPYEFAVDGQTRDLQGRRYLLSPRDLCALDHVPALVQAGVAGLKIEGRLKSALYVAAVTRAYRLAMDAAVQGQPFRLPPDAEEDLAQSFSRDAGTGYLRGVDHRALVDGRSPKSLGARVGAVVSVSRSSVRLRFEADGESALKPGDGVLLLPAKPDQEGQGGRVLKVQPAAKGAWDVTLREADLAAVAPGDEVRKTDDPAIRKRIEATYARDHVARPLALDVEASVAPGQPLRITASDAHGRQASASSVEPLQPARSQPLTEALLREQFSRLGGTAFVLRNVRVQSAAPAMAPKSVLNDLRRQVVQALTEQRAVDAVHAVADSRALETLRREMRPDETGPSTSHKLHLLARRLDQVCAALALAPGDTGRPDSIYLDLRGPDATRQALDLCRAAGVAAALATPRVVKPGEEALLEKLLALAPDAILARNLASVAFFRDRAPGLPLVADFSLNAANELSADQLLRWGAARVTLSHDLGPEETRRTARWLGPSRVEIVVHRHTPMFHMEHCLSSAFEPAPRGKRCSAGCQRRVELLDRLGERHPVVSDAACRSTVFHSRVFSDLDALPALARVCGHFRVELLHESPAETRRLLSHAGRVPAPGA